MKNPSTLDQHDRELLKEIEAILDEGASKRQEDDSLYGMCAHLASTVPQVSSDFQHQLWKKLLVQHQEASTNQAINQEGARGHFPVWSQSNRRIRQDRKNYYPSIRRFAVSAMVVLAVIMILLITAPPARAFISDIFQTFVLGPYLTVEQGERPIPTTLPTLPGNRWVIETDFGIDFGEMLPGQEGVVRSTNNLDEAQTMAGFSLPMPRYLPETYVLQEIKLPPKGFPPRVYLFYRGSSRDITIILTPVGESPGEQPGQSVVALSVIHTSGKLDETRVNGQPAVWIDEKMLVWEIEGFNFLVGGFDLKLNEAIRIAESIGP